HPLRAWPSWLGRTSGQLALDPIEESAGAAPEISALLPADVFPQQARRRRRSLTAEVAQRRESAHRTCAEQVALVRVLLSAPPDHASREAAEEANRRQPDSQ